MNDNKLIYLLRQLKVQNGSIACLGCGQEHRCSIHGCAIIRAAVGRLTELTGWTSVDDRLPDKGGWYLVYKRSSYGSGYFSVENYHHNYWKDEGITHWMQLPEPPEVTQ